MINSVTIMGRTTAPIELKLSKNGKHWCTFTLAVNNKYGEDGETYWIDCIAYERTAEFLENVAKGDKICVQGQLITSNYQDRNGNNRKSTKIRVSNYANCTYMNSMRVPTNDVKDFDVPNTDDDIEVIDDGDLPF